MKFPKIPSYVYLIAGGIAAIYIIKKMKNKSDVSTGLDIHLTGATPGGIDPRTGQKYSELRA